MSSIQQYRLLEQLDITPHRGIRKPLWCIGEGESVSFTTLSRQENENLKYKLRLARRAGKASKLEIDSASHQLDESLRRMTKIIDISSLNHAPEKFKSLQHAKRPRMWESLEDTRKKMREESEENTYEEGKQDIEMEEWLEVEDDRFEHQCEMESLQEKDMQGVIPQSRFNKIVFVDSQENPTQIQSQNIQGSTEILETPREKDKFLTQQTPLMSRIIESFDFTTHLHHSQTLTPTFKQLNEDSSEVPSTVSPDIKPFSDSFPTFSSSPASFPLNSAKANFLLESRTIEKLLSSYLRCMQIPFKITFHADTLNTTCKIFLNGNLGSVANHSSKRQAQRLACARCMKIMNKNLLLKWALSKRS